MKYYIKTYGCQMNQRDSESAGVMLEAHGYIETKIEEEADVLIFNTCSVREQAERKAIGKIGILKRLKKKRPDIFIGVMGCMAQNKGAELLKTLPHLDFVIGTDKLHELPEIINAEKKERYKDVRLETDYDVLTSMSGHHVNAKQSVSAYIAIMRGCNRFCSYCIVPFVRGREKSRKISDIVDEAKKLVEDGIKEVYLLGQNVAGFGLDGASPSMTRKESPFAELLYELNKIEGLYRIRWISPHPAYFNDALIDAIIDCDKVCKSVHLPLQSGSNEILKRMNRPYTAEDYLSIVKKLKSKCKEITFSTDIIVGFPGETDDDFLATCAIMDEVKFDNAYLFKYSPREKTKAAEYADQLSQEIKEERHSILLKKLGKSATSNNLSCVGNTYDVLVEGASKRNSKRWTGRADGNQVVVFEPKDKVEVGDIVQIKIKESSSMTLFGAMQ